MNCAPEVEVRALRKLACAPEIEVRALRELSYAPQVEVRALRGLSCARPQSIVRLKLRCAHFVSCHTRVTNELCA